METYLLDLVPAVQGGEGQATSKIYVDGGLFFKHGDEMSAEEAGQFLDNIYDRINLAENARLADIEGIVDREINATVPSTDFSFSGIFIIGTAIYLISRGGGKILSIRGEKSVPLITGNNIASGPIAQHQLLLTGDNPSSSVDRPGGLIAKITPAKKRQGGIASFLNKILSRFSWYHREYSPRKKLTLAAVVILLLVLIWSVGFGYSRQKAQERSKEISVSRQLIEEKLSQADDLSAINLNRAQELIGEAQKEYKKLSQELGNNNRMELARLAAFIKEKEAQITKSDNSTGEIFYELSLIKKDATSNYSHQSDNQMVLLNSTQGEVYVISLETKSVRTIASNDFKSATLVVATDDNVFVFSREKGIMRIDKDDKVNVIIPKDAEWVNMSGMDIFNGNIYLLDKGKGEIYKYLAGADSFSNKTGYFKSGAGISLASINKMVIDGSVYLLSDKSVIKFTSGQRDGFSLKFPGSDTAVFTDITTGKNMSSVYLLDAAIGKVIIVGKSGQYEKQIESARFKNATGMAVVEKSVGSLKMGIYVLNKDKIYYVGM